MFCSTVIATIGRPSLSSAVESVLNQSVPGQDCEIVVVNDSGVPLSGTDWQRSERVRIVQTQRRERSVARNAGAAIARGRYLHFLDDDDWMPPGGLEALSQVAQRSPQAWIYGGFRLFDRAGRPLFEIVPAEAANCFVDLMASEWIPLQASLIEARTFFEAGGFAPLESIGGGYEDVDLCRQIALHHDFGRAYAVVACIGFGSVGSTTNYSRMFEQNRISRERALASPVAFGRMRSSANSRSSNRGYWNARIIYYYLASALYNLRRRNVAISMSRVVFALRALVFAHRHVISRDFFRGVTTPHLNRVRIKAEESGTELFPNTFEAH